MAKTDVAPTENSTNYFNRWKMVLIFNMLSSFMFKTVASARLQNENLIDSNDSERSLFSMSDETCTTAYRTSWDIAQAPGAMTVTIIYAHDGLFTCWDTNSRTSTLADVYCSKYDRHGKNLVSSLLVSETTQYPNIAPDILETPAGLCIGYERNINIDDVEVTTELDSYVRCYDDSGNSQTSSQLVNTERFSRQYQLQLLKFENDNIFAVYSSNKQGTTSQLYGTIFTPSISIYKSEFSVNRIATGSHGEPAGDLLANGYAVISWTRFFSIDSQSCHFVKIDDNGNPISSETLITTNTNGKNLNRELLAFDNKTKFMTIWMHQNNHYFQVYSQDETLLVPAVRINSNNSLLRRNVFAKEVGDEIFILWYESEGDGSNHYMKCRLYNYSGESTSQIYTIQEGASLSTETAYSPITVIKDTTTIAIIFAKDGAVSMFLISPTPNFGVIDSTFSYTEDTPLSLPGVYLIKTLYDPDSMTVTVTLSNSALGTLSSTHPLTPPATDNWNSVAGKLTVTSDDHDELNCYLNNLVFTPTDESSASGVITFAVHDGINTAQTTVELIGISVDDQPTVGESIFTISELETVDLVGQFNISDLDTTADQLTITIVNPINCDFIVKPNIPFTQLTVEQSRDGSHAIRSTGGTPSFGFTISPYGEQAQSQTFWPYIIYGENAAPAFTQLEVTVYGLATTSVTGIKAQDLDDPIGNAILTFENVENGFFSVIQNARLPIADIAYGDRSDLLVTSTHPTNPLSAKISITDGKDTFSTALPVTYYPVAEVDILGRLQLQSGQTTLIPPHLITADVSTYTRSALSITFTAQGGHTATDTNSEVRRDTFSFAEYENGETVFVRDLGAEVTRMTVTVKNDELAISPDKTLWLDMDFNPSPQVSSNEPIPIPTTSLPGTIIPLTTNYLAAHYDFLSPEALYFKFSLTGLELLQHDHGEGEWTLAQNTTQWHINAGIVGLNVTNGSQIPDGNFSIWTDDPSQPWLSQSLHFLRLTTPQTHVPSTETPSQPSLATNSPLSTNSLLPSSTHLNRITQQSTPIPRDTKQALNYALVFGLLAAGFSILAASTTIAYRYWQYRTEKKKQHAETTPKLNGMFDNGLGTSRGASQFNRLSSHSPSAQGSTVSEHSIPVHPPSLEAGQQAEMVNQTRYSGVSSAGAHSTSAMWPTPPPQMPIPPPDSTVPLPNGAS